MKVLVIILILLLVAAVVLIFRQKERSEVQNELINLSLQRVKDLEKENADLQQRLKSLHQEDRPEMEDNSYQGH